MCTPKIFDILLVFLFFAFDMALMQRLLFLNVCHKLCKAISLVLSKFLQLSNLSQLLLYGLLKIRIDILVLLRLSGPLPQLHLVALRMIVQLNLVVFLHLLYFSEMLL